MGYNLSYLKEPLRLEIEHQPAERLLSGSPKVDRYIGGCVLPCHRDNPLIYNYGGGVTTADGQFVAGSGLHEPPCVVGGAYEVECVSLQETVIYLGFLLPEWGNTLTDSIKKLWFLQTEEGKSLLHKGVRIVYVTFENHPLKTYQTELFRLAGFDAAQWHQITVPTRFEEVIVPGNSMVTDSDDVRFYYPEFLVTIRDIKMAALHEHVDDQPVFDKVYLTRTHWNHKNDHNEMQIEKLFSELGFHIVSPELLPVRAQIALIARTRVLAATEGSVAHNAVFLTEGASLIILQKADYVNNYQLLINAVAHLEVTYIPVHHSVCASSNMPWAGPFYLTVTSELKAWSKKDIHVTNVWCQPSYWQYRLFSSAILRRMKTGLYLAYIRLRSLFQKD